MASTDTLTLSQLESHLREAANILRGSPVDRTDWKSYILPLLFFKRICDVWDEERARMVAEYGKDFADEHRFQVPKGCATPCDEHENKQDCEQHRPRRPHRRVRPHVDPAGGDPVSFNEANTVEAFLRDLLCGGVTHHTAGGLPSFPGPAGPLLCSYPVNANPPSRAGGHLFVLRSGHENRKDR